MKLGLKSVNPKQSATFIYLVFFCRAVFTENHTACAQAGTETRGPLLALLVSHDAPNMFNMQYSNCHIRCVHMCRTRIKG